MPCPTKSGSEEEATEVPGSASGSRSEAEEFE